eukprot:jgi/Mesen1/3215/ME000186S02504
MATSLTAGVVSCSAHIGAAHVRDGLSQTTLRQPCVSFTAFRGLSSNATGRHSIALHPAHRSQDVSRFPLHRNGISNKSVVVCGLGDFIGGDLLGFDLGRWADDIEKHGAVAMYAPLEGGTEGRYVTAIRAKGYYLMNISARGLGDLEAYLTKIHGVRPPHLGKEAIARWYYPPEIDYRLSLLPKSTKGLLLWVNEAHVLTRNELQFLALLPALRPNVKVVADLGGARKFTWKILKDVAGVPNESFAAAAAAKKPLALGEPSMTPAPVDDKKEEAKEKVPADAWNF